MQNLQIVMLLCKILLDEPAEQNITIFLADTLELISRQDIIRINYCSSSVNICTSVRGTVSSECGMQSNTFRGNKKQGRIKVIGFARPICCQRYAPIQDHEKSTRILSFWKSLLLNKC